MAVRDNPASLGRAVACARLEKHLSRQETTSSRHEVLVRDGFFGFHQAMLAVSKLTPLVACRIIGLASSHRASAHLGRAKVMPGKQIGKLTALYYRDGRSSPHFTNCLTP